jgi:hypothetical protein
LVRDVIICASVSVFGVSLDVASENDRRVTWRAVGMFLHNKVALSCKEVPGLANLPNCLVAIEFILDR